MAKPHAALIEIAAGRPVAGVADPDELVRSAVEHRMAGMLWSRVERGDVTVRPESKVMLASRRLADRSQSERLWQALSHVGTRLSGAGIEVATFKGVSTEARWYDASMSRPASDVDVLLPPGNPGSMGKVVEVLHPGHVLGPHADELIAKHAIDSMTFEVHPGVDLDVHTDIFKLGFPARQQQLIWERTRLFPAPGGGSVRVLDPEVALIQALLHLNKDRFTFLMAEVDVARILAQEELDWDFIERFVHVEGLEVPVLMSLAAVREDLGLDRLPVKVPTGSLATAWNALWGPKVRLNGHLGFVKRRRRAILLPFAVTGRRRAALRSARYKILPPRPVARWTYGRDSGPYAWIVISGRAQRSLGRLKERRDLRAPHQ